MKQWKANKKKIVGGLLFLLLLGYVFILPDPLFKDPFSTVLIAEAGELLGARIAGDSQWRFPERDTVPHHFRTALTTFEDKRFAYHPGFDPLALGRALYQNISQGKVVSGGSTLSMQVIRLARKGKRRTISEKFLEILMATRLEIAYSKQEVLALYASHAPFGGNVVGLDAAAWKYYGRKPEQLSWAEISTLAVLPNAPSLIHPGRNREQLNKKRDVLLDRLLARGILDSLTWMLAKEEALPQAPLPLPVYAPHLLEKVHNSQDFLPDGPVRSTLDAKLQNLTAETLQRYYSKLRNNGVHNAAALIVEVETGDVKAYVGNTQSMGKGDHGHAVDILTAPRSTGSILKPFLYASMLNDGELLPHALVPDIPSFFQGYTPVNYNEDYAGAVPAQKALARSLNVPAVRMLREYGIAKFYERLEQMGMRTLHRRPVEYGLTLILGGAEARMWDICAMYTGMARTLKHFYPYEGGYDPTTFRDLNFLAANSKGRIPPEQYESLHPQGILSGASIWHTFEAMEEVTRPSTEKYWQFFSSSQRIAWKTGTSFGNRDAWAVGLTPEYVVGVWVGNADGEGRPGLTGIATAAPILFELFNILQPAREWFEAPYQEMYQSEVCQNSGFLAGPECPTKQEWIPKVGQKSQPCPFHKRVWVDPSESHRVLADCTTEDQRKVGSWFVLPPIQEHYYIRRNPTYKKLPPWDPECEEAFQLVSSPMQMIYPQHQARIYVPVELDGREGRTVFELTHRDPKATVHWHLDKTYMGSTEDLHQMALNPKPGLHTLTCVDQTGETLVRGFEILVK
ncbi:MAG: penicillin-binding protein 1C [Bacteroidota bacterium]